MLHFILSLAIPNELASERHFNWQAKVNPLT